MKLRTVFSITLSVCLIVLLATACGDDDDDGQPPAAPGGDETEAPGGETTLRVAASGEGAGFWWGSSWGLGFDVIFNSYDTLLKFDDEHKPIPNLVESYDLVDDNTLVLNLREGVMFHSGDELTAEDVKYSLELNQNCEGYGKGSYEAFNWGPGVGTFTPLDDYTLEIKSSKGIARSNLGMMAALHGVVYDMETVVAESDGAACPSEDWLTTHEAGSGPYILESYETGQQVVLTAFEDYWGGAPFYDRVVLRIVPDPNTRLLLLKNGEVDIAWDIPAAKWPEIEADSNLLLNPNPVVDPYFLAFKQDVAPFNDVNFRRALIKAWPYDTVIDEVLHGNGENSQSLMNPNDPTYKKYDLFTHDLDAARDFLAQSAYPDGSQVTITINADDPFQNDAVVWYQDALSEIGVTLQIEKLPLSALTEARINKTIPFMLHRFESWVADFQYFAGFQFGTNSASNWVNYSNPRVDEILQETASMVETTDEYVSLMQELHDILVEDANWAPAALPNVAMPSLTNIEGYQFVFYHPGVDLRTVRGGG
jgi:peptide/nickel transport system substrate-binding protein